MIAEITVKLATEYYGDYQILQNGNISGDAIIHFSYIWLMNIRDHLFIQDRFKAYKD